MPARRCLLTAIILSAAARHAIAEPPSPPRIAVFDLQATGGKGVRIEGLVRGLKALGWHVETVADLTLLSLGECDIVYLSDVHSPGNVTPDWRTNIEAYVKAGGSVLQTWHHHILGHISTGIRRVYGSRAMSIVPGHPCSAGLKDFDAVFKDHIVEKVGEGGTVLLRNAFGDPVAVAGTIGKGKVVSTGLALAIPHGNATAPPRGAEIALLQTWLRWLTPNVSGSERLKALVHGPQLEVSPTESLVAAGFPRTFTVRVASAQKPPPPVYCDDRRIDTPPSGAGEEAFRTLQAKIGTPPRTNLDAVHRIHARIDDKELSKEIRLRSLWAEPVPNEKRGVWLHVGTDRHPRDVMPELKRLGINMAVLRIAGGTAAFYASKVQDDIQDPLAKEGGDWLAEAVKYADANGVELHPYVNNCVVEGRTSKESFEALKKAGRLQQDPGGRILGWFCPSQEENIKAIERPMIEIASRYAVAGIQYDFIRYPSAQGCFCPKCRALFEKETKQPVADWPEDVGKAGARYLEWVEFRCRRVSTIVERVSKAIRRVNPRIKISAAVFSGWPTCRESNGQDWVRWCHEGWLDFVCPMTYTQDPVQYTDLTAAHRKALPEGFPVLQGIGIQSGAGAMNDPAQVALHIVLARQAGAMGWVGFCYKPKHTTTLFEPLRSWMTDGK